MKKIVNVILVIVLIISIGFNIYFYSEIKRVTKIENNLIEEIDNLGKEVEENKEVLKSKESEITELETQISSKEEKIKGIQESLLSLESEKEKLIEQLESTENNGQFSNGEQSSTSGGTGNSQTSGAPGGDANIPNEPSGGISPEEAFAKFGAEFIGSGLDTSGFDHGDGDANWVLE